MKGDLISEDEELSVVGFEDEELLEQAKSKLNWPAKFLIYAKKNITEQIIFISSEKYLKKVALDMQAGLTQIYSKLERKMLSDIRDYRKAKLKEGQIVIKDIELKDMARTSEIFSVGKMFRAYL